MCHVTFIRMITVIILWMRSIKSWSRDIAGAVLAERRAVRIEQLSVHGAYVWTAKQMNKTSKQTGRDGVE